MSTVSKTIVALSAAFWIAPVGAVDAPGARPDDEAMTCERIATELMPYAQQMIPNIQAFGASEQQLYAQARAMGEKRHAEEAALAPIAQAGALDPSGASKRAYLV